MVSAQAVAVACLLTLSLAVSPVAATTSAASTAAGAPTTESDATTDGAPNAATPNDTAATVVQTAVVSQLAEPGTVRVNLTFRIGPTAKSLVVFDDDRLDVTDANGFVRQSNGRWKWDGDTEHPWTSARVRVNKTSRRFGGYAWVDAESWALVKPPRAFAFYSTATDGWVISGTGTARIEQRLVVDGTGFAGPSIAYLGDYETVSGNGTGSANANANATNFTVVVPNASGAVPVDAALGTLERATGQLRVGARRDVNLFIAPDPIRPGGLVGGHGDDTYDVWVSETESVGAPANIWIHEYVHTRQNATLGPRMRWFREASASYYAGLLSVRQGLDGHEGFEQFVARLQRDKNARAVLTNASTWPTPLAPYSKGQRALAALDGKIRAATDGDRTVMDVFRRMNHHDGTVSFADFTEIVATVSGTSMAAWLRAHVAGDARIRPPTDPAVYIHPDGTGDADGDGLSGGRERRLGTHPFDADTDSDGISDTTESATRTAATVGDTDGDGFADGYERRVGSNPIDPFRLPTIVALPPANATASGGGGGPGPRIAVRQGKRRLQVARFPSL